MKKTLLIVLTLLIFSPLSGFAFQSQFGNNININVPASGDFYVAGGNIKTTSSFAGDLILAGGQNFVDSAVMQDLIIAGGDITIKGSVGETAMIVGGNINISSTVQKDLIVGGGDVIINPNVTVQGDTVIGAGQLHLQGTLNNASLYAGKLTLQGTIKGNTMIRAETIYIVTGARILGNLEYHSQNQNAELEKIVAGKVTFQKVNLDLKTWKHKSIGLFTGYLMYGFLFLALFGIIFFYLCSDLLTKPIQKIKNSPWACLGYGFLLYAVIPFAILILMISMIGIPFGVLLLGIYIVLFAFAKLLNVVFFSHLLVDKMGGMSKVKTWKKILIILLFALVSSMIASLDIILTFFAMGALISAYITKSKKI